jgi:DNA primase
MPTSIPFMMPPMSTLRPVRIASLVSGVLACALVVAAQAAPSDPDRFVTSIYANGRKAKVWAEWLDGSRRREWFTHALTTL